MMKRPRSSCNRAASCRPRALPPALAARLRAAVLRDDDAERVPGFELLERRELAEDDERLPLDELELLRLRELAPLRPPDELLRDDDPPLLPLFG